jgi:hypothetical protein
VTIQCVSGWLAGAVVGGMDPCCVCVILYLHIVTWPSRLADSGSAGGAASSANSSGILSVSLHAWLYLSCGDAINLSPKCTPLVKPIEVWEDGSSRVARIVDAESLWCENWCAPVEDGVVMFDRGFGARSCDTYSLVSWSRQICFLTFSEGFSASNLTDLPLRNLRHPT